MNATPTSLIRHSRRQVVQTITQTSSQQADPSTVVENQTLTSFLPPPPPTAAPNSDEDDNNTDVGAVAGGVVGGVVGLALIIAVVTFFIYRWRRNRNKRALDDLYAETGVGGGGTDRHARLRGMQATVGDPSATWNSNSAIPAQSDMYSQSMATPEDHEPMTYAAPIHVSSQALQGPPTFTSDPYTGMYESQVPPAQLQHNDIITDTASTQGMREGQNQTDHSTRAENAVENTTPQVPSTQGTENANDQGTQRKGLLVVQPGSMSAGNSNIMSSTDSAEPLLIKTHSLNRNASQDLEKSPSSAYMWLPRHKIHGASPVGYTPSDASPYPST